jgi:hypothetical protein
MRAGLLTALLVAASCLLVSCRSLDGSRGPRGSMALVCTQCNIVCDSGDRCPACKARLQNTGVTKACPRCNTLCGRRCPVCGVYSVPAVRYYRCPRCGKTLPMTGRAVRFQGDIAARPKCPDCGWDMLPQTVPLRAFCPDCRVWSSRPGPCPQCGVDMSPMR